MRVSVTEAKNNLSALLRKVVAGEDVVIEDRGRPIARIEAIARSYPDPEGRIERLIAAGLLRPPKSTAPLKLKPPVKLPPGVSVLEALLEERREGR